MKFKHLSFARLAAGRDAAVSTAALLAKEISEEVALGTVLGSLNGGISVIQLHTDTLSAGKLAVFSMLLVEEHRVDELLEPYWAKKGKSAVGDGGIGTEYSAEELAAAPQ